MIGLCCPRILCSGSRPGKRLAIREIDSLWSSWRDALEHTAVDQTPENL